MEKMTPAEMTRRPLYETAILERRWLAPQAFELVLEKPSGFTFDPGQYITLFHQETSRDYTLTSGTCYPRLSLCIRATGAPGITAFLARAPLGTVIRFTGPSGHFIFSSSPLPAVFVATGVGITPFVAMARSLDIRFVLLHGVRTGKELYFADLFREKAQAYVPCISQKKSADSKSAPFAGRVTDYLELRLPPSPYAFYLCGRHDMIRDVTLLVDDRFPGSLVHAEIFY